jgi:hypothetical protein
MRIQIRTTLVGLSVVATICGTAATVYAEFTEVRGGPSDAPLRRSDYFQHCGLFIAPVAQHIHDALLHGDYWQELRPYKCDWMMRSGCSEPSIIDPVCIAKNW